MTPEEQEFFEQAGGSVQKWTLPEMMLETEVIVNSNAQPNPGLVPFFGEGVTFQYSPCFEKEPDTVHAGHWRLEGHGDADLFKGEWDILGIYAPGGHVVHDENGTEVQLGEWIVSPQATIESTILNQLEADGKTVLAGGFVDANTDISDLEDQVMNIIRNIIRKRDEE